MKNWAFLAIFFLAISACEAWPLVESESGEEGDYYSAEETEVQVGVVDLPTEDAGFFVSDDAAVEEDFGGGFSEVDSGDSEDKECEDNGHGQGHDEHGNGQGRGHEHHCHESGE